MLCFHTLFLFWVLYVVFPFLFENLLQLLSYYVASFERAEGGTAVSLKALLTSSVNVANVKTSFLYIFCRDFLKE